MDNVSSCKENAMFRLVTVISFLLLSGIAASADEYHCTMRGDFVGKTLIFKIDEASGRGTVLDQEFIGEPIRAQFERRSATYVKLKWGFSFRYKSDGFWVTYRGTLRTTDGQFTVNIAVQGGGNYGSVHKGARGQCKHIATSSRSAPRQKPAPSKPEKGGNTAAVCPADGSMPKQDGTWSYKCHNKKYREQNRVSCKTYPCW